MVILLIFFVLFESIIAARRPLNELDALNHLSRILKNHQKNEKIHEVKSDNSPWLNFDQLAKAVLNCKGDPIGGFSLSVFSKDKVYFTNSYGYADIEKNIPMTSNTVLAIGSVTKAFTATILAALDAEKKFSWEKDFRYYLPNIQFPTSTGLAGVKLNTIDLLAHRLGIDSNGDSAWALQNKTNIEAIVDKLQYYSPNQALRTLLQYNNIAVAAGGLIAMKIENSNWDGLVKKRIFDKLQMSSSFGTWETAYKAGKESKVYGLNDEGKLGTYAPGVQSIVDSVGPAGSVFSTVNDMMKWGRFHLSGGKNNAGQQLIPKENLDFTYAPKEVNSITGYNLEIPFAPLSFSLTNYALGWFNGHFNGRQALWHSGGLPGASSFLILLPESDIGMVFLSNTDTIGANWHGLMLAALEIVTTGSTHYDLNTICSFPCPWNPICNQTNSKNEAPIKPNPTSSNYTNLSDYADTYTHPAFGSIVVTASKEGLLLVYGTFICKSTSQVGDSFKFNCKSIIFLVSEDYPASFRRNISNEVDGLHFALWEHYMYTFTNSKYEPEFCPFPAMEPTEQ